jgi:hypothetical protein
MDARQLQCQNRTNDAQRTHESADVFDVYDVWAIQNPDRKLSEAESRELGWELEVRRRRQQLVNVHRQRRIVLTPASAYSIHA